MWMSRWLRFMALVLVTSAVSGVELPPLFGDHLVLQRGQPVPVWGTAAAGEEITVTAATQTVRTRAGADGGWRVSLAPLVATRTPFDLTVTGANAITLHDVLVGDVYLCSGQSNMQKPVGLNPPQPPVKNYEQEIATANYPQIRLFDVGMTMALTPQRTCRGTWTVCSPQTVGRFSAAAYFFARQLVQENGVPIGLITATWGGTMAQQWTSVPALKAVPTYRGIAGHAEALAALAKQPGVLDGGAVSASLAEYCRQWWAAHDPGLQPGKEWYLPDCDDAGWPSRTEPSGAWQSTGLPGFEGLIWYRKTVDVPATWAGKDLVLSCNGCDREAHFYFNGVSIDDKRVKNSLQFAIPAAMAKPGVNVLALRLIGVNGAGGIGGDPKLMTLAPADDAAAALPLAGAWRYQIGVKLGPGDALPGDTPVAGTLYNAMVHPLAPYAISGVLWYQGESDMTGGVHQDYRDVLGALIADWRGLWGRPELPFLLVQLPNIGDPEPFPTGYAPYAHIREAQLATALRTPHTALVITIDIGERDIHPTNKQDVGKRLALAAQALVYGKTIEACGPLFAGMTAEGEKLRLRFIHAAGLHTPDGAPLTGFAIAGADGNFILADAVLDGDTVLVSSPKVPQPVRVHYAFRHNPVCNLYNGAGLPASPFRSETADTVATVELRARQD